MNHMVREGESTQNSPGLDVNIGIQTNLDHQYDLLP